LRLLTDDLFLAKAATQAAKTIHQNVSQAMLGAVMLQLFGSICDFSFLISCFSAET
jgi:hypothetical protein